jgi:PAS domain S-box-containing protein
VSLLAALLLVFYSFLWLPPSAALLSVVVSYLLWSSRRLENAVHYLDSELRQLNTGEDFYYVEMKPDLRSIFTFLERMLSFQGWVVADSESRIVASGGHSPDLSDVQCLPGHWSNDGIDYWTSINYQGKEARIGVRWHTPGDASIAEQKYLDSILKSHMNISRVIAESSHEVIQNLIQQVQAAIINLRETYSFLDDSLSHMADGILVTNDAGKVLLANSQAVSFLGENSEVNLAGCDVIELLDKLDIEGNGDIGSVLRESLVGGISVSTHATNRSGQDLLVQVSPSRIDSGTTGNIIFNLSDISHLKSVERTRNETLSFLSHDLRSPLVSVLALLELAKNRENSEEINILHSRIESYTRLTMSLAEQFIQLARVESDANINFEVIDLASLAINAHEQIWAQAQSKSIHMVRNINVDHSWVRGDSGLLERAITNMLNNAIKYSPEGRTVAMNISRTDNHVSCCVEDEGYGIPEDELPLLFERFRRAHSNSGDDQQGIGLGLALVKATAERHGGHVEVHSTVGQGSRFCLVLPETDLTL